LGVPVIFITADYKRAGIEARNMATDILIKPVGEVAVLRSVASVLNSRWERKAVG
jgi:FixJ family two-component response regulator